MTTLTPGTLVLRVDVPLTGLRPMWARSYQETYLAPPPSTVFGMLLALVGVERENKERYAGVRIAMALIESTDGDMWERREKARILRKFRRLPQNPSKKKRIDPLAERRPDYQELLLGLQFWLWIDDADTENLLTDAVRAALDPARRGAIARHGALSLGESSHLINDIRVDLPRGRGRFVVPYERGFLSMPIWSDHRQDRPMVGTFEIRAPIDLPRDPPEECWIRISPG